MKNRQLQGIKGFGCILLGAAYLVIYETWGISAYVYFGVGFVMLCGLFGLLVAALMPDSEDQL